MYLNVENGRFLYNCTCIPLIFSTLTFVQKLSKSTKTSKTPVTHPFNQNNNK